METLIKEGRERDWYLIKEWETKAGLKAKVHQCRWKNLALIAPSLHDFYTGYVQVPSEAKIDEDEIDVHGGITFSRGKLGEEEGEWIGFDMAHYGDENSQDLEYAVNECERMAEQVVKRGDYKE